MEDNENDNDLSHLLDKAADPPVATADSFREVMARYQRGRTRSLLAALVAVALLGPAVGIAVGRATTDGPTQVATGRSPTTPTADSATSSESRSVEASTSSGFALGSPGFMGPDAQPAKRLFIRTTADGVTIRGYLRENLAKPALGDEKCATDGGEVPCPPPPPADCFPDTQLQAELSNEGAVDPGFVHMIGPEADGPLAVLQTSYFGITEGDPAAWVAVKADDSVAKVRVRLADGATDEMAPVEGYAVLAHGTAAPPQPSQTPPASEEEAIAMKRAWMPQGTVEALDAAGNVIATADLASEPAPFPARCISEPMPPPAAPPDGSGSSSGPGASIQVDPAVPATSSAPATASDTPATTAP